MEIKSRIGMGFRGARFKTLGSLLFSETMNKAVALVPMMILAIIPMAPALEEAKGEGPASETAEPAKPAAPATETVHDPTKADELRPLLGQTLTVCGRIVEYGESKSGDVRYLNYSKDFRRSVALVFFMTEGDFPSDLLRGHVGKDVRVTGPLSEHKGALQIVVGSLSELKVQESAEGAPAETPAP